MVIAGLVCGVVIVAVGFMWFEAHRNRVRTVSISVSDLPQAAHNKRLFFISDIHRRVISRKVISAIEGNVDWVLIGGDLTEKGVPWERVAFNLQQLRAIAPVYVVYGNNDYEVPQEKLADILQENDVIVLKNDAITLVEDEQPVVLVGVDDRTSHRDDLDVALSKAQDGFRIVLTHHPGVIEQLPEDAGIRLALAGHTHGGQIRFFRFGLYEKGRLWKTGNMLALISNGYGTTALPFRLGAPTETHLFQFQKADVQKK